MKIVTLSRINTGMLVAVAAALLAALILGGKYFKQPIAQIHSFSEVRTFLNEEIVSSINAYLRTGDATYLSSSENKISELNQKVDNIHIDGLDRLRKVLDELKRFLASEARAAGKLAGNEEGLLLQNERETRDEISRLLDYSDQGIHNRPELAQLYRSRGMELLFLLQDRSMQRQQMLAAEAKDTSSIEQLNDTMLDLVGQIKKMDRLGIVQEEEEDDFAALMGLEDEEQESANTDQGEEIVDSLNGLISRYPKEIRNTISIKELISTSHSGIQALLVSINDHILIIEDSLADSFGTTVEWGQKVMGSIIAVILVFTFFIDRIQNGIASRIRNYVPYLQTFAAGDFREEVKITARTQEVKSLRDSANKLRSNLSELIGEVKQRSEHVAEVGVGVRTASDRVALKMQSQVEQTLSITASIEEMTASFHEVAQHAANAAEAANDINNSAQESNRVVQEASDDVQSLADQVNITNDKIIELEEYAKNINSVLEVITGVAEQTNLLALNAAIEAARAGEHGRGFSVVAEEVRNLSQRTADSAHEIHDIIENIQKQTQFCSEAMRQQARQADATIEKSNVAGKAIESIVSEIAGIRDMTMQIAVTTEQQATVAESISQSIHEVNDISNQTKDDSQSTARMSDELQTESGRLQESLEHFYVV